MQIRRYDHDIVLEASKNRYVSATKILHINNYVLPQTIVYSVEH